jgi:hypothetical protein
MDNQTAIERMRAFLNKPANEQEYERIEPFVDLDPDSEYNQEEVLRPVIYRSDSESEYEEEGQDGAEQEEEIDKVAEEYSRLYYAIFLLLGIAMLWAW